jgi:hypothetical protein
MAIAFGKGFQNNELDNQQMYLKLLNCVLMSLLGYANHTDFVLENEWPKS